MNAAALESMLAAEQCAVVEDRGCFALVHPSGYQGRMRAHDLAATTRAEALAEAWAWLHPHARELDAIANIAARVATTFGVSYADLHAETREHRIVTARHVAMLLARELVTTTLTTIGAAFGGRGHTTVACACSTIQGRAEVETPLAQRIAELRRVCAAELGTNLR